MGNSTAVVEIPQAQLHAASQGWVQCVEPTGPKRLIVSTQARDKCGKTHFGFTMPGPIGFLNLDRGYEGVIEKFLRAGKKIYRKDFVTDPTRKLSDSEWDQLWYALRAAYVFCVTSGYFRSVFIDTGSAFYEAMRMAAFGKLSQVPPLKYTEVYQEFEALLAIAYNYPVNVTIAHRMKQDYVKAAPGEFGTKSDIWSPTGYKDMAYVVQVAVNQAWDKVGNVPALQIASSRFDNHLNGLVLSGPMCNFPTLGMMIHGAEYAADFTDDSKPLGR